MLSRSKSLHLGQSDETEKSTQLQQSDQMKFELKRNEASSITSIAAGHYISTEDNVAYIQTITQISTEGNVAYGQILKPQISLTEENVAYGQVTPSGRFPQN